MDEEAQDTLFTNFRNVVVDVVADKRKNPKNVKTIDDFQARINMGLHVEEDFILWVNLVAKNGTYTVNKGKLTEYDLELISDPIDLMYFTIGQYSTLKMMFTKNKFGKRRLQYRGGTTGSNIRKLLKLPKILVLDI